jgi:hypothetical protein
MPALKTLALLEQDDVEWQYDNASDPLEEIWEGNDSFATRRDFGSSLGTRTLYETAFLPASKHPDVRADF